MTKKTLMIVSAVIVIAAMSFWAGLNFQKAQYKDACLDLGGGEIRGSTLFASLNSKTQRFGWDRSGPLKMLSSIQI